MALTIIGAKEKLPPAVKPNLRYGDGRLVVWGCRSADTLWHIARRGSFDAPQGNRGHDLVIGKSLCGQFLALNGYSYDYTPPGVVCGACAERL